jgi:hypothetical protein
MKNEQTNVETGSNSQGNSPSLATVLSQLSWGGNNFPSYEGRCEATADAGAAATSGAGAGAGGGAGDAAGAGAGASLAEGGASPAPGQSGGSSTPNANDGGAGGAGNGDNIRTLRQNYETLKPWEKIAQTVKDPNAALTAYQQTQKLFNNGLELAKALGYTEDSYKAAFDDDPVDTLSSLRAEHAKANPQAADDARIRKIAEDAARNANRPVTEEINRQKTEVALNKYDSEFDRLLADDKVGFGPDVSDEVKQFLYKLVDQSVPDAVLAEIKATGKVSGLQPVFEQAKAQMIKVVNAYATMTTKKTSGGGNASAGGNGRTFANNSNAGGNGNANANANKPITLDDIINNPDLLPGVKAGKY